MPEIRGRALRAAAVGVVLPALGACGADAGLATGPTSALRDQVVAVRAAATAGDAAAARSALDAFRGQVHRLVESGELDPAAAVELLAQADRVGTGLDAELTPAADPPPKPTPRPAVRTERQPDRSGWSDALAALIRARTAERDDDERRDRHDRDARDGRGNHDDED